VIDDLTIAANGRLDGSRFDKRAASGAAESTLSSVFGNLLQKSTSIAASKSSAIAATARQDEEPRTPEYREPLAREAADYSNDDANQALRNDGDQVSAAGREEVPLDRHDNDQADSPDPHQDRGGREEGSDAASDAEPGPGSADETSAVGDGSTSAGDRSGPKHGNAVASNLGSRGVIPAETPNVTTRSETVVPLGNGLLKSGGVEPQRPTGQHSAGETQTTVSSEAINIAQRQAGALAKAIGNGGRMQVSVTVAMDAETLISQPSHTLAAATVTARNGDRSRPGRNANGGQAGSGLTSPLHPTTAPAQIQLARLQQAPSPLPAQAGAAPISHPIGTIIGEPPVVTTDAIDGDPIGLGTATSIQRGAGLSATQATSPSKPAAQHHSIVDQISVNITKAVKADMDKIEIRLRPESLGRVEVSLEVARDGRVVAAVTADSRDTLELLRADARGLERALQDAGLKADSGSLSFSLRGHDTAGRQGSGSDQNVPSIATDRDSATDGDAPPVTPLPANRQGATLADGRIDIRA
jgi:flagellar hook-length control protein FliK